MRAHRLILFVLVASFVSRSVTGTAPVERTEFTKRRIASMQPELRLVAADLSLDGSHVAYVASDGKREYPVLDERAGAVADTVYMISLGKSAAPFAYMTLDGGVAEPSGGIRGGVSRLFVDEKEKRKSSFGGASLSELLVLADSGEVAYTAFVDGKARVVAGDRESPKALGFGRMTVSRAGNRIAYGAEIAEGTWKIGIGTDFGPSSWPVTADPVLSANGASVAYYAGERVDALVFHVEALPARTVTYRSETTWKGAVTPVFSDDGAHFATAVSDGTKWRVIHDGKLLDGAWDSISGIAMSPSGKRLGWIAQDGGAWKLILDGKVAGKVAGPASGLLLDDEHYAYALQRASAVSVVLDGRDVAVPTDITDLQVALGKAGTIVFRTRDAKGHSWLHLGNRLYGPYEWVTGPWFSADGKNVTWACLDDGAFWWRVAPSNATDDPELRRVASLQKARQGDFAGAIVELDKALVLAKGDPELLAYRGRAKAALGRAAEARADYDAALAADKNDVSALSGRYLLRLAGGDLAGARADALELSRISGLATGWVFLAELDRDADTKGALTKAERGVALAPWWSYALTTRASIRLRLRDYKGVLADTELAMKQNPSDSNAWYIRAGLHAEKKKLELACADLGVAKAMGHVDAAKLHGEICTSR